MNSRRNEALEEFLVVFDQRLEAAPVVDRRAQPVGKPIDGQRAKGPVTDAFAYWESKTDPKD